MFLSRNDDDDDDDNDDADVVLVGEDDLRLAVDERLDEAPTPPTACRE